MYTYRKTTGRALLNLTTNQRLISKFGVQSQLFHRVEFLDQGYEFKVSQKKEKALKNKSSSRQLEVTDLASTPLTMHLQEPNKKCTIIISSIDAVNALGCLRDPSRTKAELKGPKVKLKHSNFTCQTCSSSSKENPSHNYTPTLFILYSMYTCKKGIFN